MPSNPLSLTIRRVCRGNDRGGRQRMAGRTLLRRDRTSIRTEPPLPAGFRRPV